MDRVDRMSRKNMMNEKRFALFANEREIECSILCNCDDSECGVDSLVILCHGFADDKDSSYNRLISERIMESDLRAAAISFDLPCHGDDGGDVLLLEECDVYIRTVTDFAREAFEPEHIYAVGISFGAYLILKYISEHGDPYERAAFLSAAVTIHDILLHFIMTEEERKALKKGETVMAGFDVKVPVTAAFVSGLHDADIREMDLSDVRNEILLVHGVDDEVVSYSDIKRFSEDQGIQLVSVPGADHRFLDEEKMEYALEKICGFLGV